MNKKPHPVHNVKTDKKEHLKVLILEDMEIDAILNLSQLEKDGFAPEYKIMDDPTSMKKALSEEEWDIILSDYSMPQFRAPDALEILHESGLDLPFIVISGTIGEDIAVEVMRAGAHDYFLKGHLKRLGQAIRRELEAANVRKERRIAEENLRERVKELSAFYYLSTIVEEEGHALDTIYQKITEYLPECWRFPERTCCKLEIGSKEFKTKNFRDSPAELLSHIKVNKKNTGTIKVGYLESENDRLKKPFSVEEQILLDAIAERLGTITEHIRAEEKIKENEEKYRSLIENSNDAIYLLHNRKFEIINNRFEQMFGYSLKEVNAHGFDFTRLVAPESRQLIEERQQKAAKGKKLDPKYEFTAITKDGEKLEIETSVTYIQFKDGLATQGIIRDISERKRYEKELIKAKEKAEESDRLKSAFLANISHEIRTPLNGILGFTDLLNENNLDPDEKEKYIDVLKKCSDRMLSTINDIIDISRIEAGEIKAKMSQTSVNELIDDITNLFTPQAKEKGLILLSNKTLPDHGVMLNTDHTKLEAILSNLVKNAIKYTRKGSIVIGYHHKGQEIEFYVKDSGIGIPEKRQQAIFERFVQADLTTTKEHEGSGLGLSISKAYAELLGGKIWLKSKENFGSTFYFSLPVINKLQEVDHLPPLPEGKTRGKTLKNHTLLIVDDDETTDLYLSEIFKDQVREIIHAKNGEEAVEICRNHTEVDIILMDIKMPDKNGYEATKEIRTFNNDVIIIAQTAYAMEGDREKAMEAGCDEYIAKPVKKEELLKLIEKVCQK
jgi:PAS domain S-box-containing protein